MWNGTAEREWEDDGVLHFSLRHRENPHWGNEYRARYSLREAVTGEKLSEAINLLFIELGCFDKSLQTLENDKERFYFCMKHMPEFERMPEEFEGNEVMERLFKTTSLESLSKTEKIKYISFMTTERDRRNQERFALEKSHDEGLAEGLQKGLVQGRNEGLQKGRLEMASIFIKNLKASGMSDWQIAQMSGISEENIRKI